MAPGAEDFVESGLREVIENFLADAITQNRLDLCFVVFLQDFVEDKSVQLLGSLALEKESAGLLFSQDLLTFFVKVGQQNLFNEGWIFVVQLEDRPTRTRLFSGCRVGH